MKNEGLPFWNLVRGRQFFLRQLRIDVRVLGVVEDSEELIQAHVDRRRLNHLRVERINAEMVGAFGIDSGTNITI